MKTGTFSAAVSLVVSVSAIDFEELEFVKYMAKHQKFYHTMEEFVKRKGLFEKRVADIEQFMSTPQNFTVGLNYWSDFTKEEMKILIGERESEQKVTNDFCEGPTADRHVITSDEAPVSVDWRNEGMVSHVRY